MPPRKSNISAVSATGDEGTPVKEREREGINVEVCFLAERAKMNLPIDLIHRISHFLEPWYSVSQKASSPPTPGSKKTP